MATTLKTTTQTPTDLREWLKRIDEIGELQVVTGANTDEDIGMATEILGRTRPSKATIFDEIVGYKKGWRVLSNGLGSFKRIAVTLGLPLDGTPHELVKAWQERVRKGITTIPAEVVKDGPVFENVMRGSEVDVLKFPAPKWHEFDGGRYIGTGSFDVTKDPDDGWVNLGTYRVMVQNKNTVGFYISPGKHGRQHRDKWFARGEKMPVAFVPGGDPLLFLAACTEIPFGITEYDWAGGVRGAPYRVVKGPVTGLPIPADAEIVMEGFASETDKMTEGPFGEWTGYYASGEREEPVMRIAAIYHRNDPIVLASPPNVPPDEQSFYRAFMRSARLRGDIEAASIPGVTGVWCHEVGGSRLFNAISITQKYAGHARQVGHAAATVHSGAYLGRYTIVVDDDIDVMDLEEVLWAMCTRSDPSESIDIIPRMWSGPLDPRIHPDKKGLSSRAIIDATRPWEWRDKFPRSQLPTPETKRRAMEKWGWLVGKGERPAK
ncbi:MAG TPA: UbiD family decarboxylase [Methylomirabilota bacterium]|nr:UbiD family decarboxylase [Methylomirabilota bacterium]